MEKLITIVCPMRNERPNLPDLCRQLEILCLGIQQIGLKVEVLFMDNASTDNTEEYLKDYILKNSTDSHLRYIRNKRDIGLQASLMTSMEIANGDALVVLHSDLEDPPELVLEFITKWKAGHKAVVGVMRTRQDPILYQLTSKLFYKILTISSDQRVLADFTDFFLIDQSIYKDIALRPRNNQFIRGIISANYGVDSRIDYNRRRRKAGQTHFNFVKRYEIALDAVFALGTKIPRYFTLFSIICMFTITICDVLCIFVNILKSDVEIYQLITFNVLGAILLISASCFEILFRIYNFLLNTTRSYLFDEFNSDIEDVNRL